MKKILFIVNPRAGRGIGLRTGRRLEQLMARDNPRPEVVYTREPGEARRLASESKDEVIVAVGGDGTINEVVNGIAGSGKSLGIIPSGSGNDSIKSLHIPLRTEEALDTIRQSTILSADLGLVEWTTASGGGKCFFLNGVGIGFDAAVAHRVTRISRLRGTVLYIAAVLFTIREFRPPHLSLTVDGVAVSDQDQLLVAVGNGPCAGGGFFLTPRAQMTDGVLELCAISAMSPLGVLRLMPKVLRAAHSGHNGVTMARGARIEVSSTGTFPVHADGEILSLGATTARITINPGVLTVLVPTN